MEKIEKYFNLNDSSVRKPRGFVFAYDENGDLLFAQENMIVESGRIRMMQNGFDKGDAEITKVVLGDSNTMTAPESGSASMGKTIAVVTDRLVDVIGTVDKERDDHQKKRATLEQAKLFTNIVNNSDITDFSNLTIDKNTSSIVLPVTSTDSSGTAVTKMESILYNTKGIKEEIKNGENSEEILGLEGYDKSCFEISSINNRESSTDNTPKLVALAKIFVRYTTQDDPGNNDKDTNISNEKIHCLGLFMKDDILFSRVVFPPYYKTSTQALVFDYYIYF